MGIGERELRTGAPAALWQALVRESAARGGVALDELQESYLVMVLLRYQGDDTLLARVQALDWLDACALPAATRSDAMRDVGDRCLLVAGLFPGLAERRRVRVEYFIDIGRGAYREVAALNRAGYAALFAQLQAGYRALVDTLSSLRGGRPPGADAWWQAPTAGRA
jgi:hypothetical protein